MYLVLLLYNTYSCIPLRTLLDGTATDGGDGAAVLCSSSAFSDQALTIVHTYRHSSLACGWPRSPRFISLPQTRKLADGTENLPSSPAAKRWVGKRVVRRSIVEGDGSEEAEKVDKLDVRGGRMNATLRSLRIYFYSSIFLAVGERLCAMGEGKPFCAYCIHNSS